MSITEPGFSRCKVEIGFPGLEKVSRTLYYTAQNWGTIETTYIGCQIYIGQTT